VEAIFQSLSIREIEKKDFESQVWIESIDGNSMHLAIHLHVSLAFFIRRGEFMRLLRSPFKCTSMELSRYGLHLPTEKMGGTA
jgi:hypothetical protein